MDIKEQELDILSYIRMVQNHKRLIAFIAVLFIVTAFIYTYVQTPQYRASTSINIEMTNPNLLPAQDAIIQDVRHRSFFDTQERLITSRTLARRVIEDLDLLRDPPARSFSLRRTITGLFRKQDDSPPDPERRMQGAISGLLANINVDRIGNTNIIQIRYSHPDPHKAAQIADAIADQYINLDVERRFNLSMQANQFIGRQLENTQREIAEAEAKLLEYGRSRDIVSLADGRGNIVIEQLAKLNTDYTQAVTNRITLESYYNTIRNTPRDQIDEVARNTTINNLKSNIASLEQRVHSLRERFQPDYPELRRLEAELTQARQNLQRETEEVASKVISSARAQYESALQKERQLHDLLENQKQEAQSLHADSVEYQNLLSIVNNKRRVMEVLLQRQSETEIASQLDSIKSSSIHIVDRAVVPTGHYSPNMRMNILISMVLGLGFGFLMAYFIEYLDDSLKTPDDVENYLQLATLGIIPKYQSGSHKKSYGYSYGYSQKKSTSKPDANYPIELISHYKSRLTVSEAYRSLRTAVLLSSASVPRKILVTSSIPSEGKTSTATNLAITLAQMGKKTLIVDIDLRRPKIYKVFNRKNTLGLVNHIVSDVPLEKIIQKSQVDNLYTVISGPIPPQPSELLISDKFVTFVENISKIFDHIIFDAPPVLPVTDPSVIAHLTDCVILVVKAGDTSRSIIKRALQKLAIEKIKISGITLNNVDMQRSAHYYYKGRYKNYYNKYYTYGEDLSDAINGGAK